jgi:hypothetical protein
VLEKANTEASAKVATLMIGILQLDQAQPITLAQVPFTRMHP